MKKYADTRENRVRQRYETLNEKLRNNFLKAYVVEKVLKEKD